MRKQSKTLVLCLLVAFLSTCFIPFNTKVQAATPKTLINAVQWADTDGNSINARWYDAYQRRYKSVVVY